MSDIKQLTNGIDVWNGKSITSMWKQGDSRNVSRPLACILMEANIGHIPTKFGHNQMQGWKVINCYRILQVNFHIWPHLTFDLLMWPLTPEYTYMYVKIAQNLSPVNV